MNRDVAYQSIDNNMFCGGWDKEFDREKKFNNTDDILRGIFQSMAFFLDEGWKVFWRHNHEYFHHVFRVKLKFHAKPFLFQHKIHKKIIFVIILCGFLTCKCYVFKKFSYLMQISTYERCNNFLFVEENLTKWPLLHAAKRASLSVNWRVFSRGFLVIFH